MQELQERFFFVKIPLKTPELGQTRKICTLLRLQCHEDHMMLLCVTASPFFLGGFIVFDVFLTEEEDQ